jgi:hypothetical protein
MERGEEWKRDLLNTAMEEDGLEISKAGVRLGFCLAD